MLYRKEGLPDEGQIVICTVTKIQFHSIFVRLDEYDKEGMIHISEIAAGRIRNMRDYVKEGKMIVCKVLQVSYERGSIDLSLRRVTEKERREKTEWMKKEQLAEKIIENVAHILKKDFNQLYEDVTSKVFKKYEDLNSCFAKLLTDSESLEALGIEKAVADNIKKIVLQRMKPEFVHIKGELKLISYEPNGVEVIKEAIRRGIAANKDPDVELEIKYAGAGIYTAKFTAHEYKEIEKAISAVAEEVNDFMEKNNSEAEFIRNEE
ncbi:translation initiation factor IF-2 subunit alpha [Candidatus Woesearchaeota archaeon CG07_land_8_20_14_0_80_44_23]|nr:MAG: translation initiation factor IF-2 subunit alpha [Candidatus Woesearchaeota archaeon CG07_land_8_20_14_0_80_44_23]